MDSRIEPLAILGLSPRRREDLRNAGVPATDEVLRTLVLASCLIGVARTVVIAHTGCRMVADREDDAHEAVRQSGSPDTASRRSS